MKILLVNPPLPSDWYNNEFYLPLSLLYLGAGLRESGNAVSIFDMKTLARPDKSRMKSYYEAALLQRIEAFKPDLIGIGCLFSGNFPDVDRLAAASKKAFPQIPIVAGGIHPTIYAAEILENCPAIDWIVLGEAEESLLELVHALQEGQQHLEAIDGLAYRNGKKVVLQPKTRFIADVDRIPFPAYDLVNLQDYFVDTSAWHNPKGLPINTSIPIISSRSCPHQCTFCSMYRVMGPKWRARSAQNVVDEIEYLYHTYQHRHFSFMDDNLTLSRRRTLEICGLIHARKLDIQFETPNGLSLKSLDEEVIDQLVDAGMVRTYLAIESGSDYIRNQVMRKNVSREQIYNVVRWMRKHPRLFVNAFFIIGMPEETEVTLEATFQMIKELDVDKVHIHNIVPFPSTKVYEQALKDGILLDIDPDQLYKAGHLYFKNRDCFFVRPYHLDVRVLHEFRGKVEAYLRQRGPRTQCGKDRGSIPAPRSSASTHACHCANLSAEKGVSDHV